MTENWRLYGDTGDMDDPAPIEPTEALRRLVELQQGEDEVTSHVEADLVLLGLIRHLGHGEIAVAFSKVPRWYS